MSVTNLDSKLKMPSLHSNEKIKRLIQSASILVKQLDSALAKAKNCKDLFTTEVIELRNQLAHLCLKSMAADPLKCRRRAEELLWKKCFYDVIAFAKIHSKKSGLTSTDKLFIGLHINSGIMKFSELLEDLYCRMKASDPSVVFSIGVLPHISIKPLDLEASKETKEDLKESIQKTLICLGDLSRYQIDLEICDCLTSSERFYKQAVLLNPNLGLPFNQLGTLTSHDSSRSFESIFYYLRSIKASKVFPGAEPNLKALLARLVANQDKLTSSFSQLILKLVFSGKDKNTSEISHLCQVALVEIQNRLRNSDYSNLLNLTACAVMCSFTSSTSGDMNESNTAAVAFCCSLFSHLLNKWQQLLNLSTDAYPQGNKLKQSNGTKDSVNQKEDFDSSDEEEEEETKRAKLRRRKLGSGSSDQEFSEEEIYLDTNSEVESEEEAVVSDSGFDSAEAKTESALEIPEGAGSLLSIFKLLTDWIQTNPQVLKVSSQTIRNLLIILADILNALARCPKEEIDEYESLPLEEDWKFYGVNALASIHREMDFEKHLVPINTISNSIRIKRIILFGYRLARLENIDGFTLENGIFNCAETDNKADVMMRNMAHLWLKSEVQELERKLSPKPKRRKKANFDLSNLSYVYMVPDVSALSEFFGLIKQVIKSQKLIVVIPDIVISELDELKKESSSTRECIRWLESCFKTGNRFVRAQRVNEHQTIPLLTYPKRKDKLNWVRFQILECCYYLDSTQRNVYKTSQSSPIVVFLTGNSDDENSQQKGVFSSIGVDCRTASSLVSKSKPKKEI